MADEQPNPAPPQPMTRDRALVLQRRFWFGLWMAEPPVFGMGSLGNAVPFDVVFRDP